MTGLAPPREDGPGGVSERDRKTDQVQRDERANSPSQRNGVEQERERAQVEGNPETTGQAAASTSTHNLPPQTRTRIHEFVIRERNAPRVSPDFAVSIGARVPTTVRFAAVPRTIVEIQPEWRGFTYFMVRDQMVIFNPRTMAIVAIVDA
jgi:hypothetical protein